MAIKLSPGQKKTGTKSVYEIVRQLNNGMFAAAYEAKNRSGRKVFFKEYKSPSPTIEWFEGYVAYQTEIKRRIENDADIKGVCYEFIDFFTDRFFYQVFEFVEGGMSLQQCLDQSRENPSSFPWETRVKFSTLMMLAINKLHKSGIIHTDLKPDNIYLMPNPHVPGEYWVRIIDLDFAILADKQAPWHGINGYVGTPGYQSPEHISKVIPSAASDVFTCGIMLGQLLTGNHPFAHLDADGYLDGIVKGGAFTPIEIAQPIKRIEDLAFLEGVINSSFDPDPEKRPSSRQVADALLGKIFEWNYSAKSVRGSHDTAKTAPSKKTTETTSHKKVTPKSKDLKFVEILFGDRALTQVHIDTTFGKYNFKGVDDDAKFLSEKQFRIFRDGTSQQWMIEHVPSATNDTIVNGQRLEASVAIEDGMTVSVGNVAKGIEKFTLVLKVQAS